MKHDNRYIWFDFIRGLAALMVCAGHLRAVVMEEFTMISSPNVIDKALYFLTGLGHQAVVVFFVLSGFFVGGSVLRMKMQFNWSSYLVSRLSRLWVVLIPALALTYLVDAFIASNYPEVLAGSLESVWHLGPVAGQYSNSILTLLGNLFFMQGVFTSVFGTNGPLWSLANEFWYYMLFPLGLQAILALPSARGTFSRFIAIGFIILIMFYMPIDMRYGLLIWLFGVVVYWALATDLMVNQLWLVISATIFVMTLVYSKLQSGQLSDLLLGASFSTLCIGLAKQRPPKFFHDAFIKLARSLSEFSYSLYLSHFPIVMLIGVCCYGRNRVATGISGYSQFALWFLILLGTGGIFWWLFEKRTKVMRQILLKLIQTKLSKAVST